MTVLSDIQTIIRTLQDKGIIEHSTQIQDQMKGTTDGQVYTLSVGGAAKYILKVDNKLSISGVKPLLAAYPESPLLPKLLFVDPAGTYIVYTYIAGTTHYNRGVKIDWLKRLVTGLLNHYEISDAKEWGRLEMPRSSWGEFNRISLEGARQNVDNLLPAGDYEKVQAMSERISYAGDKYLLHGDTGVHNFVFRNNRLAGVIDPSPMAGPVLYDFTYAFCSSPDDLNLETLLPAFDLLGERNMERSRLIEEVIFQLYCRIGICARVHPHDLEDYLKAWEYWRIHLM